MGYTKRYVKLLVLDKQMMNCSLYNFLHELTGKYIGKKPFTQLWYSKKMPSNPIIDAYSGDKGNNILQNLISSIRGHLRTRCPWLCETIYKWGRGLKPISNSWWTLVFWPKQRKIWVIFGPKRSRIFCLSKWCSHLEDWTKISWPRGIYVKK